jgi:hypothetical protein
LAEFVNVFQSYFTTDREIKNTLIKFLQTLHGLGAEKKLANTRTLLHPGNGNLGMGDLSVFS